MEENQKKYLNALNIALSPNPEGVIKILSSTPLPEKAFNVSEEKLKKLSFHQKTIANFFEKKININIEKEWQELRKTGIRMITKDDKEYPKLLKEIAKPPAALYIKGTLLPKENYFAVVGTRWPSDYGKMITPDLVSGLLQDFTIISGMARGIDSLSQRAAIERNKRTVAIVGTGLETIFPPENKNLSDSIEKNGAVISEFPLNSIILPYNFPLRNRIIAGMAMGTLVIEGKKKSGALITANSALEEGREVFAVPGPIFSKTSEGPNNLIKQGASLTTDSNDILAQFNLEKALKKEKEITGETEEENLILAILKQKPISIDEIIRETKIDAGKVNSTLILMEIKKMIKRSGNQYYKASAQ